MAETCNTVEMMGYGLIQVRICYSIHTNTRSYGRNHGKKESRCSTSIQNSFQMRFIYGPYTPEHTQKRLDLTRQSSTPRTEIRPCYVTVPTAATGSIKPYNYYITDGPYAGLCHHTTVLTPWTIPRCCHRSDFYCVSLYEGRHWL